MNKMLSVVLSIACVGIAQAQVFSVGGCPAAKAQTTFDLNRYLGDWYELFKFDASFESGQVCARAHYELKPDGHILIRNSGLDKDGKNITAIGDAFIPDPVNEPAKLKLRFSSLAPYGNYWVLDTDYDDYTFIYSCSGIVGITHFEFAWILSRHKNISMEVQNRLFSEATSMGIDVSNFHQQFQESCPDL